MPGSSERPDVPTVKRKGISWQETQSPSSPLPRARAKNRKPLFVMVIVAAVVIAGLIAGGATSVACNVVIHVNGDMGDVNQDNRPKLEPKVDITASPSSP